MLNGSTARRVAFKSFGCKLNQYEIQALREGFLRHGFTEVPSSDAADYYVLNTCTVTAEADREARRSIRVFHRLNPDARIVVTGCYATASPSEVRDMPGVSMVVDNRSKNRLLFKVAGLPETTVEESPFFEEGISYFEDRSRAFLKAQDGCDYFCAFCKIPYVRGRLRSRAVSEVLSEAARLVGRGYEEIVLSGVCLGSYGRDFSGRDAPVAARLAAKRSSPRPGRGGENRLTELLRAIAGLEGHFRVRLSSIDPRDTPLEIADLMSGEPKICAHFHLSLQSGDDGVLAKMRRGTTAAQFEDLVGGIRSRLPEAGFSTDVIAGFPGEDGPAFENTRRFLKKISFHRVHVFPYSDRPGTRAAAMGPKVPGPEIRRRVAVLVEDGRAASERWLRGRIGGEQEVLAERRRSEDGAYTGFSADYARCVFEGPGGLEGKLVRMKAFRVEGGALRGERVLSR